MNELTGANILVGDDVPLRGLVDAVGLAADALINEDETAAGFSVASTVLSKGGSTSVVIGASDDLVSAAAQKGLLYGAYNNYITSFGVSALWNGYITQTSTGAKSTSTGVTVKGDVVLASPPDNLINPPSEFIFVDKDATKKGPVSEQDALSK